MKKISFDRPIISEHSSDSCVQAQQEKWLSRWYHRLKKVIPLLPIFSFGMQHLPFQEVLRCQPPPIVQFKDHLLPSAPLVNPAQSELSVATEEIIKRAKAEGKID
jgi:hypothetical protein